MSFNTSPSLGVRRRRQRVLAVLKDETNRHLVRSAIASDHSMVLAEFISSIQEITTHSKLVPPDIIIVDDDKVLLAEIAHYRRWIRLWNIPIFVLSLDPASSERLKLLRAKVVGFDEVESRGGAVSAQAKRKITSKLAASLKAVLIENKSSYTALSPNQKGAKTWNGRIVLVGASTGGVGAIETLLAELSLPAPPVLITQHMPKTFLERFAERLNKRLPLVVRVAHHDQFIENNHVYIAPGGHEHLTISHTNEPRIAIQSLESGVAYNPSIEVMMQSAVPIAKRVIAVMLTGMGRDGVKGMSALHDGGALCLAQDRASSTVYGMPRAAAESGIIDEALPVEKIARRLIAESINQTVKT